MHCASGVRGVCFSQIANTTNDTPSQHHPRHHPLQSWERHRVVTEAAQTTLGPFLCSTSGKRTQAKTLGRSSRSLFETCAFDMC